jgi:hypothetical protein
MSSPAPRWPAYSAAFFLTAICFLFIGVGLGIFMSVSEDHTLRPVHAHVNLLGWVTSAIMGLFYAHVGDRLNTRLIWIQYAVYTAGVVAGMIGLAAMLSGNTGLKVLLMGGTAGITAGVILFAVMVVRAARIQPA